MDTIITRRAPDGRNYDLKFVGGDSYLTVRVTRGHQPVGYAKLSLKDKTAKLEDIQILEWAPNANPLLQLLPLKWFRCNFRGRGIGSLLLHCVCGHLRTSGFVRIEGTMSGDIGRLVRWYRKAGFVADLSSRHISKELVVHSQGG